MRQRTYPSDVSDEEWEFASPYLTLMDPSAPQRTHSLRTLFNAIRWLARAGAPWLMLPHDFPPWEAVYPQMQRWLKAKVFEAMVNDLQVLLRWGQGSHEKLCITPLAACFLAGRARRGGPEEGVEAVLSEYRGSPCRRRSARDQDRSARGLGVQRGLGAGTPGRRIIDVFTAGGRGAARQGTRLGSRTASGPCRRDGGFPPEAGGRRRPGRMRQRGGRTEGPVERVVGIVHPPIRVQGRGDPSGAIRTRSARIGHSGLGRSGRRGACSLRGGWNRSPRGGGRRELRRHWGRRRRSLAWREAGLLCRAFGTRPRPQGCGRPLSPHISPRLITASFGITTRIPAMRCRSMRVIDHIGVARHCAAVGPVQTVLILLGLDCIYWPGPEIMLFHSIEP